MKNIRAGNFSVTAAQLRLGRLEHAHWGPAYATSKARTVSRAPERQLHDIIPLARTGLTCDPDVHTSLRP